MLVIYLIVAFSISALKKRMLKLDNLARLDSLTGLYNRRAFYQTVVQEASRSGRSHSTYTIAYLDVDNFKQVNDTYGHVGGDDFILVVPTARSSSVTQKIVKYFDHDIITFYNRQDIEMRCIQAKDRRGHLQIYPIMSISIAGIDLSYRRYSSYLEVNDACVEMKKLAKAMPGSTIYFDQRKE